MLVSFQWLKDYVDIEEPAEEIAEMLTRQGLEVSSCEPACPDLQGVVAGRVLSIEPHAEEQALSVCRVDAGRGECTVLCGASNVRTDDSVPLALPGARLPSGRSIEAATLHGVHSEGMLCSERELGLSEDHEGILQLPAETSAGTPLEQVLEDYVLEIELTPNRPDCLSVIGIAREIAAKKGRKLRLPEISLTERGVAVEKVASVEILAPEACHRYVARILEGVRVVPSPFWLRRRLLLAGFRPINNIVDVTNFVMLEYGQPLHAFDLDRLEDQRIVVRKARRNEYLTTLDGVRRELTEEDLLICDARNAVALAGVMGGQESEIQPGTERVLLESAFFEPKGIRRTSKRLGISTESSHRFEREIDKQGTGRAADRAADCMIRCAGGHVLPGAIDVYPTAYQARSIPLQVKAVNRLLGTSLGKAEVTGCLQSLEIEVRDGDADSLEACPPSFRPDVRLPEDLIEEVARMHGYDEILTDMPTVPMSVVMSDPERKAEEKAREVLVGSGFCETIHYSFFGDDRLARLGVPAADAMGNTVTLQNPLSEKQSIMRTTLLCSLLDTVAGNIHRNNRDLRLFELRRVFSPSREGILPVESKMLAGVMTGRRYPGRWNQPDQPVDFFDLKGVMEVLADSFGLEGLSVAPARGNFYLHPGYAGDIQVNTTRIGCMGKLHPKVQENFDIESDVFLFEVDFSCFVEAATKERSYRPFARKPSVQRDLALVLDQDVPFGQVLDKVHALADRRMTGLDLFDLYQGPQVPEGKKSMALRITYQDPERTLTDEEVNELQETLLKELLPGLGARLR